MWDYIVRNGMRHHKTCSEFCAIKHCDNCGRNAVHGSKFCSTKCKESEAGSYEQSDIVHITHILGVTDLLRPCTHVTFKDGRFLITYCSILPNEINTSRVVDG